MNAGTARLWTGIGCVGTMVIVSVSMLAMGGPNALLPDQPAEAGTELIAITVFFAAIAILMLPFDLVGGVLIPAACENQLRPLARYVRSWGRSVSLQLAFYSLTFFLYLQIGREIGAPWLIALFAVLQVSLLSGQELIWNTMTSNRHRGTAGHLTLFVKHSDTRFAGGVTGLPGFESILIPQDWQLRLQPDQLKLLVKRRRIALSSGGRLRGIIFAMLWNITSFALAIILSGAVITCVADLATVYLWFLLFSFAGLLVLPVLNRGSVFALDRCLANEHDVDELQRTITAIDRMTDQDPHRSASVESVFQPIPCPQRRFVAMTEGGSTFVSAWNVARTALFLSWAFGGPLARAVHCNVGRPELWALLPTD